MDEETPRLALPLLAAGQAQKEITHNEALARLDIAVQAAVEANGADTPPTDPAEGACWIVGAAPTGAWGGHAGALAGWSAAGWRFVTPHAGMAVWDKQAAVSARYDGAAWVSGTLAAERVMIGGVQVVGARRPAIAAPTGGSVTDAQARTAIGAILTALRTHGLVAS